MRRIRLNSTIIFTTQNGQEEPHTWTDDLEVYTGATGQRWTFSGRWPFKVTVYCPLGSEFLDGETYDVTYRARVPLATGREIFIENGQVSRVPEEQRAP